MQCEFLCQRRGVHGMSDWVSEFCCRRHGADTMLQQYIIASMDGNTDAVFGTREQRFANLQFMLSFGV